MDPAKDVSTESTTVPYPKLLILVVLVGMFLCRLFDRRVVLLGAFLTVYIIYDYRYIVREGKHFWTRISKSDPESRVTHQVNGYKHTIPDISLTMDDRLRAILRGLRKYRRYNRVSYSKGMRHIHEFQRELLTLHSDTLRTRHNYENALSHSRSALQEFQGLIVSTPSLSRSQAIQKPTTQRRDGVGPLCQRLREYMRLRLLTVAYILNQDWAQNPDIYKSEIHLTDVRASNETLTPHFLD
jgi:hypothetical protein